MKPPLSEVDRPLLEADGVSWSAGRRRILDGIDLTLESGECLALVGPNGAGKTTLLRALVGILRPDAGAIRWQGDDLRGFSRREVARRIAYVPQVRPASVPLTVEQLVLLGRHPYLSPLRPAPSAGDFVRVRQAMDEVGIMDLRARRLDRLSGGERQAAYIAAALAQRSGELGGELLVLDEPTTHLDPRHQRQIAEVLDRLNRRSGLTLVFATHDLNLASLLAQRILGLRAGRVVAGGPPDEVLDPDTLMGLFDTPFRILQDERGRPMTLPELGS